MGVLALVLVAITSVADVPKPSTKDPIVDVADVVDVVDEAALTRVATELAARGIALVVVTLDSAPGTPKEFATKLFNHWQLGSRLHNTGILLLLVVGERRIEIETGRGIEAALPAEWLATMQARDMVPRFRLGQFGAGLAAATTAISARLTNAPGESPITSPAGEYRSNGVVSGQPVPIPPLAPMNNGAVQSDDDNGIPVGTIAGISLAVLALAGVVVFLIRRSHRERICRACRPPRLMVLLDGSAEDELLTPGQRSEEKAGAVDHRVYMCNGCKAIRTVARSGVFARRYSRCPACTHVTVSGATCTTAHATYDTQGTVETVSACAHCGWTETITRHTPQLERPDASESTGAALALWGASSDYSSSSSDYSSSSSDSSSDSSDYSSSSSDSSSDYGGSSDGGGAGSDW